MTARAAEPLRLFTVGHSNHPWEHFLGLLQRHAVSAVADVRSTPFSRRNPQFSRPRLERALDDARIAYLFLGRELGARSPDPAVYRGGRVDYALLAATRLFQAGLVRLEAAARGRRVAILCAEKEPLDCHRTLLVSRQLAARGAQVAHVLADGSLETHEDVEDRLLATRLPAWLRRALLEVSFSSRIGPLLIRTVQHTEERRSALARRRLLESERVREDLLGFAGRGE